MTLIKSALLLSTLALTLAPFNARAETKNIYEDAMDKMHKDMMAVKPTGDADVDFVRGMISHHQGAIDMAKVVLKEGKDPEIKKMAEGIVAAQESEIKHMNDWLKAHQE